jgi:hypothetical protein
MRFADINSATAAGAIGEISKGMQVFAFSKGQYGLLDCIKHIALAGSDWSLTVSAWQATGEALARLSAVPGIKSARFLIDESFPNRQPSYAWQMLQRFGDDSLLVTKSHAKFALMRSSRFAIVIRTSMNLNEEQRLEMIEVDDNPAMFDVFDRSVIGQRTRGIIKPAQGGFAYA